MAQGIATDRGTTRQLVSEALASAGLAGKRIPGDCRFVLIVKVDDDSLSDRLASFHDSETDVCVAIEAVRPGWWPDCVIDLEAPVECAVRDAAVGDGSLGPAYPFDEDHVVFA